MDESVLRLDSVRRARVFLRAARQRSALQIAYNSNTETTQRTNLLPVLSYALESRGENEADWSETAREILVDCAASVALAPPFAKREDELSTLSASVQVLCYQEQFARLRPIAPRLNNLASQWDSDRPFLAAALRALSQLWRGDADLSAQILLRALGLTGTQPPVRARRDRENSCDFLLASGLRKWITTHFASLEALRRGELKSDSTGIERALQLAVHAGIASTYELASVAIDYARAVERGAITTVLPSHEALFAAPEMASYLLYKPQHTLFPPQRQAIENGVLGAGNALLTLPTSGGKTMLAELRILAELHRHPEAKVIYLAPYRTLASQVETSLHSGLKAANLSVRDYGADIDLGEAEAFLQNEISDVAVMTPEKFDALWRLSDSARTSASEMKTYLASVRLFIWDELQVIGRSGRGPRLELLLARIRQRFPNVPFLGLSGVIAGGDTVARWLNATVFGSTQRPTGVLEALWSLNGELWARIPNGTPVKIGNLPRKSTPYEATADLVALLENNTRPVLVMATRPAYAASILATIHKRTPHMGEQWLLKLQENQRRRLFEAAEEVEALLGDQELAACFRSGLALHHARLPATILRNVERLAEDGLLRAIVSTPTVAEGAHLPFRAVVIPHLTFENANRRLEKDLYDNIVGRAGRAGVAAEGMVFVLDSPSKSLQNYVQNVLWQEERAPLRGALSQVSLHPDKPAEFETLRQVKSQVLAWLGDEGSYLEGQANNLTSKTLSSFTADTVAARNRISGLVANTFQELEEQGLAMAASPFQLTATGQRARIAGLSPASCLRLMDFLDTPHPVPWESLFENIFQLDNDLRRLVARTVFLTDEVLSHSLWLSGQRPESSKIDVLRQLTTGETPWPLDDEIWRFDVELFGAWLSGYSLGDLAALPAPEGTPTLSSTKNEPYQRIAFLNEHLVQLAQPVSWAWSGTCALTTSQGEKIPLWIRRAVEHGVYTQTAAYLTSEIGISRMASLRISSNLPAEWLQAQNQILEWTEREEAEFRLTRNDLLRLSSWKKESSLLRAVKGNT